MFGGEMVSILNLVENRVDWEQGESESGLLGIGKGKRERGEGDPNRGGTRGTCRVVHQEFVRTTNG